MVCLWLVVVTRDSFVSARRPRRRSAAEMLLTASPPLPSALPFPPHRPSPPSPLLPASPFVVSVPKQRRGRPVLAGGNEQLVDNPANDVNGDSGENDSGGNRMPPIRFRWRDVLDPDPENLLAVALTGLLTWASVQVLWQLFFISVAILVAAVKYSFIAALLLFILITLL